MIAPPPVQRTARLGPPKPRCAGSTDRSLPAKPGKPFRQTSRATSSNQAVLPIRASVGFAPSRHVPFWGGGWGGGKKEMLRPQIKTKTLRTIKQKLLAFCRDPPTGAAAILGVGPSPHPYFAAIGHGCGGLKATADRDDCDCRFQHNRHVCVNRKFTSSQKLRISRVFQNFEIRNKGDHGCD